MPETALGANVKFPSTSTLNVPVVFGVTSVLDDVTATPFNLSAPLPLLSKIFPTKVETVVLGTCAGKISSNALSWLLTRILALAISQLTGFITSHI